MDLEQRLSMSYYKTIAVINESHKTYLVQHQDSGKFFVKKTLDIYSLDVYKNLKENPIPGTPNIIELVEDNKSLILIEDYIPGISMQDLLDSKKLSKEQIISYMSQLCEVVDRLHSHNPPIIHRDIKPSNIIITNNDDVILLDFNAAKYKSNDSQKDSDTILIGTQGYAAPEQYGFKESSPQTDIYSIGILLKNLVSVLPAGSKEFNQIIEKCTQMDPDKRYSSVSNLRTALLRISSEKRSTKDPDIQKFPFLPPGFRTLKPWKIAVAAISYAFMIYVCCTAETEGATSSVLIINRISYFLFFIGNVFIAFNYMNIQKVFPLCRSSKRNIRILGILALMLIYSSILFTLTVVITAPFIALQ